jgi:hypothetical protein
LHLQILPKKLHLIFPKRVKLTSFKAILRNNKQETVNSIPVYCQVKIPRRKTTSRVLPDNADEQARSFIQNVHMLMTKEGIKYKNVINFDQVRDILK